MTDTHELFDVALMIDGEYCHFEWLKKELYLDMYQHFLDGKPYVIYYGDSTYTIRMDKVSIFRVEGFSE